MDDLLRGVIQEIGGGAEEWAGMLGEVGQACDRGEGSGGSGGRQRRDTTMKKCERPQLQCLTWATCTVISTIIISTYHYYDQYYQYYYYMDYWC